MIEPTDEMLKAFARHFFTCFRDQDLRDALAAVLAIVERDYILVQRHDRPACVCDGSGRICSRHSTELP